MDDIFSLSGKKVQDLRYGENPHQKAALYGKFNDYYEQLQGKELSYNNILDLTAATALAREFAGEDPAIIIVKHTNACGVGQGANLVEAWDKAFATDIQAPFGGIIASNVPMDAAVAAVIAEIFTEVTVAPDFSPEALAILQTKKNLRLMKIKKDPFGTKELQVRSVGAESFLVTEPDVERDDESIWKVVTKRAPTEAEMASMKFGWRVAKHEKSNAILFAGPDRTLGVGAGQMSRVNSTQIAIMKAKEVGLALAGSAVASDAFFPFPDGLIAAIDAGASAVIQPGGSLKDADVIAAADLRNVAMIFTGTRHFKH
jgi:phosphoribosylaminoimidazolecarboxamide formyltransferase/IMP cyclohydrolase